MAIIGLAGYVIVAIWSVLILPCTNGFLLSTTTSCNFEINSCGFATTSTTHMKWYRKRLSATSSEVPHGDHTHGASGGYVMYIRKTYLMTAESPKLTSPNTRFPRGKQFTVSFWITQQHTHPIHVDVNIIGGSKSNPVYRMTKATGNWEHVCITDTARSTGVHVEFILTTSVLTASQLAIDDFVISSGDNCPTVPTGFNCTFDHDTCGFTQGTDDDFNWTRHKGATISSLTGPDNDHTSGQGYYMYIETSSPRHVNDKAHLVSPTFSADGKQRLVFWYNMHGHSTGTLNVYLNHTRSLGTKIYTDSTISSSTAWQRACVDITSVGSAYNVIFEGIRGSSFYDDIAIDDVTLESGNCSSLPIIVTIKPIDGHWSTWSSYATCSVTCGHGTRISTRTCTHPAPTGGGHNCTGSSTRSLSCTMSACPVHGHWATWSHWDACSVTCGAGTKHRNRTCTNPAPAHGGHSCVGSSSSSSSCTTTACPVDGHWAVWGSWGKCTVTCDTGTHTRHRTCSNPAPAHGGKTCPGVSSSMQTCSPGHCVVNGGWGSWSSWSTCSVTCGSGVRTKTRHCDHPIPAHGGHNCTGTNIHHTTCIQTSCPVDGHWSTWGSWGQCSVTCDRGVMTRTRSCTNPSPAHGGHTCNGTSSTSTACVKSACPVDGHWSTWGSYGKCSVTCGSGTMTRTRTCTNPAPAHGGHTCAGSSSASSTCTQTSCPVDGHWSTWTAYGTCSVTCGDGKMTRQRTCSNPAPAHGGSDCAGVAISSTACSHSPCPVDGHWATWQAWSTCSVTCGNGTMTRDRQCSNPEPAHGGDDCVGSASMSKACTQSACPVDGDWSTWQAWSKCSVTCGTGFMSRTHTCTNPIPAHGGKDCDGDPTTFAACQMNACPVNGGWSDWEGWGACAVTCGSGTKSRHRACDNPTPTNGGDHCSGSSVSTTACTESHCPVDGVWSTWEEWGACSASCGQGTMIRQRACANPAPAYGGKDCEGDLSSSTLCQRGACPVNGGWSEWEKWGTCSVTCGGGTMTRHRTCTSPTPAHGGSVCTGTSTSSMTCTYDGCPVDGQWSDWSPYGACSVTCDMGVSTSTRTCTNPAPAHGGATCPGSGTRTEECERPMCFADGAWSDWSTWSACSTSCGMGVISRQRSCDNPAPAGGGKTCDGDTKEAHDCSHGPCPEWSHWYRGTCSVSCGNGTMERSRQCSTGLNSDCPGTSYELVTCSGAECI